ncbi:uncharacterized protein LOC133305221 [Gastrolobium bilobum]|uniref:uncharacterized protein LOC133305221 n=1 Tax=Gastrolobium bilobum TaxID=150636 RepID=UPI002AB28F07|nr:uncharacterized protein LOC133305221 [Gastrolobium bilobum]
MNKLRQEYSSFKKLLSISSFGWNTVLKTATTEDASLWDVHIKENPQWDKFRKNGLPYWEELVEIFGDVYASGDNAIGNAEVHQISDGDGDNIDSVVETPSPVLHRQEYKEDEHMLNEDLFASDPIETPSPAQHRQDRAPNAKRKRGSKNTDIAMTCQAIQDLVKIRQNQCHHNYANSATAKVNEDPYSVEATMDVLNDMVGLENEVYRKAVDRVVESKAWRVAFIKAPPERRASLL